jgi:hypothetical protein
MSAAGVMIARTMSFDPPDFSSNGSQGCSVAGCDHTAVVAADVCRAHLVDVLRAEGRTIVFDQPDFAALEATAVHLLRTAMDGMSEEADDSVPLTEMDMYVSLEPEDDWAMAQVALDFLGTHIADEFGAMQLSPPMSFASKILLRLRAVGPGTADELRPRLAFAMEAMIREVLGPEASMMIAVEPPDDGDAAQD